MPSRSYSKQGLGFTIFLLVAASWLTFLLYFGRAPSTDEVFFKCPGLSWLQGGPWAAKEETGYLGPRIQPGIEEIFFTYPPGYSFGFGLFAKLFGFGWRTCVAYDAVIHLALVITLGIFFGKQDGATRKFRWWLATGLIFAGAPGRPDELAMLFGYAGLAVASSRSSLSRNLWISNFLLACCSAVSVPCIMVIGAIRAGWILFSKSPASRKVLETSTLLLSGAVAWVATALWATLQHPRALSQNITVTLGTVSSPGADGIQQLLTYYPTSVAASALLTLFGVWQLIRVRGTEELLSWCQFWAPTLLVWIFFFTRYTHQGYYYWFWTPWLFAAALRTPTTLRSNAPPFRVGIEDAALGFCCTAVISVLAVQNVRHLLITATLPEAQHWTTQSAIVRSLVPPGSRVLAWAHWWSIGDQCRVYDNLVADYLDPENLDYMVLTAHGTGKPGAHQPLPEKLQVAVDRGEFEVVHSTIDSANSKILGIPLSNSGWGAGSTILKAIRKK